MCVRTPTHGLEETTYKMCVRAHKPTETSEHYLQTYRTLYFEQEKIKLTTNNSSWLKYILASYHNIFLINFLRLSVLNKIEPLFNYHFSPQRICAATKKNKWRQKREKMLHNYKYIKRKTAIIFWLIEANKTELTCVEWKPWCKNIDGTCHRAFTLWICLP